MSCFCEAGKRIELEIANYEKQMRQSCSIKDRLMDEIDALDPDEKHYYKRKNDLDNRLYSMYDKIESLEISLDEARAKKLAIESKKITGDNIYKILLSFNRLYAVMSDTEKRKLIEVLIAEIQIYEERQPNGQWIKSIKFKLPIVDESVNLGLDDETQNESVVCLTRRLDN